MGAHILFKMLPAILLLISLIFVESASNSRVTRALPPKYLSVENHQQCLIDLVKPGGSDGYCFPSSRPADCPKSVWRKLKREYKVRNKRSAQNDESFEPSPSIPSDSPPASGSFAPGAPIAYAPPSAPGPECTATSKYGPQPCIFPFTFNGNTYYSCTEVESSGEPWCAYNVDNNGVAITGQWANCDPGCPGVSSRTQCTADVPCPGGTCPEACEFPFTYKRNTYNRCTKDNSENGRAWCKTVSGKYEDCNPGCPGYSNNPEPPRPYPPPPPPTDVRLRSNGEPEVYINGGYRPICGHFFWDNKNGADLFCRELNYQYRSGEITSSKYSQRLGSDAVKIGKCKKNDYWKQCTGGCNNLQVGGNCLGELGSCRAGSMAGIRISCSTKERERNGKRKVKLENNIPYVKRSRKWVPICGHYFWDNNNGATLFCEQLGFPEGKIIGGTYGTGDRYTLQKDALKIGKCTNGDSWLSCTDGCNDLGVGGRCPLGDGPCSKGDRSGVKIECRGYPRNKRAVRPAYLDVPGHQECLEEHSAPGSSSSALCLPQSKPEYCSERSWNDLQDVWEGNGRNCPPPDDDPIEPIQPIGGFNGLAPKYQNCLTEYFPPSGPEKCLPAIKPARPCRRRVYKELLQQIFG